MASCCENNIEIIVKPLHGNIANLFDCCADPVVYLLQLKNFTQQPTVTELCLFFAFNTCGLSTTHSPIVREKGGILL